MPEPSSLVPMPGAVRHPPAVAQLPPLWRAAAAFGGLWGALEVTLGPFLHAARIPFAGTLLALAGVVIMAAARRMVPRRGVTVAAALVAATCRTIAPGGALLGPMVGIVSEGLLMEVGFLVGRSSRSSAALAGALAALWPAAQQLGVQRLVYGHELMRVYGAVLEATAQWLGLSSRVVPLLVVAVIPASLGAAAGLVGWRLGGSALRIRHTRAAGTP